jgi:hypothetical protein
MKPMQYLVREANAIRPEEIRKKRKNKGGKSFWPSATLYLGVPVPRPTQCERGA